MKFNLKSIFLKKIVTIIVSLSLFLQILYTAIPKVYAASTVTGDDIVEQALTHVGAGYSQQENLRYGPDYFDCTGLVYTVIEELTGSTTNVPTWTGEWEDLMNAKKEGDIIELGGMKFKLTKKNVTITDNPEYFEKPGTIMIFDGHAAISVGSFNWQGGQWTTIDFVIDQLATKYGASIRNKVSTDGIGFYKRPTIYMNSNYMDDNYNSIWKVDALNETYGVAVNNTPYGKSSADTLVLGVWEPVVDSMPKNVTLTLEKRIKANEINWENGTPTFLFDVTGMDIQGNSHTYHKVVSFSESYVTANTDSEGYVSISVTFSNITAGTYTASEEETSRYKLESISNVVNGKVNGESVTFDLINNESGSVTFTNVKYEWGGYSHSSCVVNTFQSLWVPPQPH